MSEPKYVVTSNSSGSFIKLSIKADNSFELLITTDVFGATLFTDREVKLIMTSSGYKCGWIVISEEKYLQYIKDQIKEKEMELEVWKQCYDELTIGF